MIPLPSTISTSLPVSARRGWTRAEFEKLVGLGLFAPEEQLELIEGDIVLKRTQNPPHATALYLTQTALLSAFGTSHLMRVQLPLALGERNRPEPDVAVVQGSARDYATEHPTSAVLVVEISDATLAQDREIKCAVYARVGVAEYWITQCVTLL